MGPKIMQQIKADAELVNSGQIREIVWHFFGSPKTGRGASKSVLAALKKYGIEVKYH